MHFQDTGGVRTGDEDRTDQRKPERRTERITMDGLWMDGTNGALFISRSRQEWIWDSQHHARHDQSQHCASKQAPYNSPHTWTYGFFLPTHQYQHINPRHVKTERERKLLDIPSLGANIMNFLLSVPYFGFHSHLIFTAPASEVQASKQACVSFLVGGWWKGGNGRRRWMMDWNRRLSAAETGI